MLGNMVRNQESPLAAREQYFGMTKCFNCTAKVLPDGKSPRKLGVGEGTVRRALNGPGASERCAKTPQRRFYERRETNPDEGGAEGLVNFGRLGVLNPG